MCHIVQIVGTFQLYNPFDRLLFFNRSSINHEWLSFVFFFFFVIQCRCFFLTIYIFHQASEVACWIAYFVAFQAVIQGSQDRGSSVKRSLGPVATATIVHSATHQFSNIVPINSCTMLAAATEVHIFLLFQEFRLIDLIAGIGIPYNCQISDCSYLHSNSCYEHSLITTCCCNNPYQYHKK